MTPPTTFVHDPDAVLDYTWPWATWLDTGDTIVSHELTVDPDEGDGGGLVVDSSEITEDATSVTAWISGGVAGRRYRVTCHIETDEGREDDRTFTFDVRER